MSGANRRSKASKKAIFGGIAAVVALTSIGLGYAAVSHYSNEAAMSANNDIVTETVQAGDISQAVTGTGSLVSEQSVNVLVPADLEVEEVYVKQGDTVEVGTPIARVSSASIRAKQLAIEENIDTLQKQYDDMPADTKHYNLKRQVLQEQIIDLQCDREAMAALQETLTLTSDTAGVVSKVTVYEGIETGKPSLRDQGDTSQNNAQTPQEQGDSAEGAYAQQSTMATSAEDASPRATTADMASSTAPVAVTAAYRVDYPAGEQPSDEPEPTTEEQPTVSEALEQSLQAMSEDSGEDSTTPDQSPDEGSVPSDDGTQDASEPDQNNAEGDSPSDNAPDTPETPGASDPAEGEDTPSQPSDGDSDGQSGDEGEQQTDPAEEPIQMKGSLVLNVTPPATGAVPQRELEITDDEHYTAALSWAPNPDATFAPETEYICIIHLTAAEGYCFSPDPSKIDVTVPDSTETAFEALDLDDDGYAETLKVEARFSPTHAQQPQPSNGGSASEEMAELESLYSLGGGYDAGSSDSESLTKEGSSYSDTEAIALTVTPNDKMFLEIKVDELDVVRISVGQEVQVTLDALEGETFEGTVEQISDTAVGSGQEGSSAKFTARIRIPLDERMRYGMSAKASIAVGQAKDAPIVPIDAISEVDGQSVVYTAIADDGTLASPVQVETGLSDGDNVEVTSGLNVGDTICYTPTTEGDDEYYYY